METTPSNDKDYWSVLIDKQQSKKATNLSDITRISSYYFIFNCSTNEIEYVNNSFEQLIQEEKSSYLLLACCVYFYPVC